MAETLSSLKSMVLQAFPGKPTFTEKDVPDLTDKVCIVTGSNTGLGKELANILYSKNAHVYIAARSEEKSLQAIESIKDAAHKSEVTGKLTYLPLDLADLSSVKRAAEQFLGNEQQLHLLINNAGVAFPAERILTKQGYEQMLGVNCLGHFLFTKLLTPRLISSVKSSAPGAVRVVWVSSSATELTTASNFMNDIKNHESKTTPQNYGLSKIGNYLHATEYAARHKADDIISVSLNPGNLNSDLWRDFSPFTRWFLATFCFGPVIYGTYTELYAAFSHHITLQNSGCFVAPYGKIWHMALDKVRAVTPKSKGGYGAAQDFWEWSEEQVKPFV